MERRGSQLLLGFGLLTASRKMSQRSRAHQIRRAATWHNRRACAIRSCPFWDPMKNAETNWILVWGLYGGFIFNVTSKNGKCHKLRRQFSIDMQFLWSEKHFGRNRTVSFFMMRRASGNFKDLLQNSILVSGATKVLKRNQEQYIQRILSGVFFFESAKPWTSDDL